MLHDILLRQTVARSTANAKALTASIEARILPRRRAGKSINEHTHIITINGIRKRDFYSRSLYYNISSDNSGSAKDKDTNAASSVSGQLGKPEELKVLSGPMVRSDSKVEIKHRISLHKPSRHGRALPEHHEQFEINHPETAATQPVDEKSKSSSETTTSQTSQKEGDKPDKEKGKERQNPDAMMRNAKGEVILGQSSSEYQESEEYGLYDKSSSSNNNNNNESVSNEEGTDKATAANDSKDPHSSSKDESPSSSSGHYQSNSSISEFFENRHHNLQIKRIHHFDTHKLTETLSKSNFTKGQAKVLTYTIRDCISKTWEKLRQQTMTQSDLENDVYYYQSSLAELKTEIQVMRKNNQFILQTEAANIEREIDSLKQQMKEDMDNLRSDIQIEMNSRKNENRDAIKKQEMGLHEISTKYQVIIGDMRTDIEAIKLFSIRRGLTILVITSFVVVLYTLYVVSSSENKKSGSTRSKEQGSVDKNDDLSKKRRSQQPGAVVVGGDGSGTITFDKSRFTNNSTNDRRNEIDNDSSKNNSRSLALLSSQTDDPSTLPHSLMAQQQIIPGKPSQSSLNFATDPQSSSSSQEKPKLYRDFGDIRIHYVPDPDSLSQQHQQQSAGAITNGSAFNEGDLIPYGEDGSIILKSLKIVDNEQGSEGTPKLEFELIPSPKRKVSPPPSSSSAAISLNKEETPNKITTEDHCKENNKDGNKLQTSSLSLSSSSLENTSTSFSNNSDRSNQKSSPSLSQTSTTKNADNKEKKESGKNDENNNESGTSKPKQEDEKGQSRIGFESD
ncbi:hypothetical protein H4219_003114 [Mycoemilia scoparia]|uniref:Uncharacterized protein n=1 Tax=Mycoemilia scoparia TaxID=417184 RepID=A0A9W8DNA6_9FUNG|nr:hypothetical protein H4219_003114 [Mycoemilia scoparia]